MTKIHHCPLVEWYRYSSKCQIITCKFNTDVLDSGCIAIERIDTNGKKLLTDRELRYYKFNNDITVQEVTQHRKKVMIRVKRIIALHYYVDHIFTYIDQKDYILPPECEELLTKAPFKLKRLNINNKVLGNMFILNNFTSFKNKVKLDEDFQIWDLFFMTQKRWDYINDQFLSANTIV